MESTPTFTFAELLADFPGIREELHAAGVTPNDPQAFARRGFQRVAPTADYTSEHTSFINARCDGELSDDALADHCEAVPTWWAFCFLGLGYLLGLYQNGDIDDREFALGDAQFAGFIFLHAPTLHDLSSA